MFNASCSNEEKVLAAVSYTTSRGLPAIVDGPTLVEVLSGDGTVEPVDAHRFYLVSGAVPGDTVYAISADADLGDGIQTITDAITLTVSNAQAAAFGVTFGVPVPK